jgi:hypothetical protein
MQLKLDKAAKVISSKWLFVITLLIFSAETSWLALTTRFPMAFDEAYHLGIIQFYSHRLNPIITSQPSTTYKFGALVHGQSFLYHYLMSFPYRLIEVFTKSPELQVIGLRLINIALAVASLLVARKLLRLIKLSDGLANVVILAFALTPLFTALSAQINYDNLLVPVSLLCVYVSLTFVDNLRRGVFDVQRLLILLSLCLFSSEVKFTFVPIFIGITLVAGQQIIIYWRRHKKTFKAELVTGFKHIPRLTQVGLVVATIAGSALFMDIYGYNIVQYHNPVPQCNQILTVQDCKQYYSWDKGYLAKNYDKIHPPKSKMNILQFSAYWLFFNLIELVGEIMPLQGFYYISPVFFLITSLLGIATATCVIVNFKTIVKKDHLVVMLTFISLVYLLFLWGRNYHDYLQLGQPEAIDGRYFVPVLLYLYVLLASGLRYSLTIKRSYTLLVKLVLALVVIFSFTYYGGYSQYASQISPVYGRLSPSNDFTL